MGVDGHRVRVEGIHNHQEVFYLCKYDANFYEADLKSGYW